MGGASIGREERGGRKVRHKMSATGRLRSRFRAPTPSLAPLMQRPRRPGSGREDAGIRRMAREIAELTERLARERPAVEGIKEEIAKMPGNYSANVNKVLFAIWASDYDEHMAGHVAAIEHLIRKAHALQSRGQPIFGEKILDMTCGTGSIIDLICRLAPTASTAREMQFIANDITPEMQVRAMEKIAAINRQRRPRMVQRYEDLRKLTLPPESVDTAMLSQTFHMITDPRTKRPMNGDGDDHYVKARVIESALSSIAEGGHFVLIDEWQPILTNRPGMEVIDALFHETFKPMWDKQGFIDMMKRVRTADSNGNKTLCARLVAELKAWIDPVHRMYIFIYQKDPDKMYNRGIYLPDTPEFVQEREEAVDEILERFMLTDHEFVASFAPDTEEKKELTPFEPLEDMDAVIINSPKTKFRRGQQAIIFSRVLHDMPDRERYDMIENAVNALSKGGVLLFVDEFHHPMKSDTEPSKPHPWRKSALRADMKHNYDNRLIFEGAMRVPLKSGFDSGMYGFMYRKI